MSVRKLDIVKYKDGTWTRLADDVAEEAPLSVRVEGRWLATLLRMPAEGGNLEPDRRLAAGWLFSEGIIDSAEDLRRLDIRATPDGQAQAEAWLVPDRAARLLAEDFRPASWSARSDLIDPRPARSRQTVTPADLARVKTVFEGRKDVHPLTGAAHSALLFDRSLNMIAYAEDIGRHNALDKAVGELLLAGRREEAFLAVMSSRLSLEIAAKAVRLGVEILAGVSTTTTLAASLADQAGLTLIGFFRTGRMNIYAHPERVRLEPSAGPAADRT